MSSIKLVESIASTMRTFENEISSSALKRKTRTKIRITQASIDSEFIDTSTGLNTTNSFIYKLPRRYLNVKKVSLTSLEFPNSDTLINDNNRFLKFTIVNTSADVSFGSNYESTFTIGLKNGNYTVDELIAEIQSKVNEITEPNGKHRFHLDIRKNDDGTMRLIMFAKRIEPDVYVTLIKSYSVYSSTVELTDGTGGVPPFINGVVKDTNDIIYYYLDVPGSDYPFLEGTVWELIQDGWTGTSWTGTTVRINNYTQFNVNTNLDYKTSASNGYRVVVAPSLKVKFLWSENPDVSGFLGFDATDTTDFSYVHTGTKQYSINTKYCYLTSKTLGSTLETKDDVDDVFTKVDLNAYKGIFVYNDYITTPRIYKTPVPYIDEMEFSLKTLQNTAYDLYNRNYSFTLEIVEYIDIDESMNFNSNSGIYDNSQDL